MVDISAGFAEVQQGGFGETLGQMSGQEGRHRCHAHYPGARIHAAVRPPAAGISWSLHQWR